MEFKDAEVKFWYKLPSFIKRIIKIRPEVNPDNASCQ